MRIAWLTDIHLEFVSPPGVEVFFTRLLAEDPEAVLVGLTSRTGLLGHGSWADGRLGSGVASPVLLNDYVQIREFISLGKEERFRKLAELGDEAAAFVEKHLPSAAERYREILFLTHVPPFREAAWHEGRASADDWLPHFGCKAVGDALVRVMRAHPGCSLTVLCGHTHGDGEVRVLENLLVWTGGAEYGKPTIRILEEVA